MQELDLPASVLALAEFSPCEDVLLALLREDLPDVPCLSLIPDDSPPADAFFLVRRVPSFGQWGGDPRFMDKARFAVHTFTTDPDGDEKGAILSEAVRVIFRDASRLGNRKVFDSAGTHLGTVRKIRMVQEPVRRPDWATATGPVQYADLPTGTWRYESQYTIEVRKPR